MTSVQKTLQRLESRFYPKASAGQTITFQFVITDDKSYALSIRNGELDITEEAHANPDVTLTLDSQTFAQMISGELDGMTAFTAGKLHTSGNMILAPKLRELFPLELAS